MLAGCAVPGAAVEGVTVAIRRRREVPVGIGVLRGDFAALDLGEASAGWRGLKVVYEKSSSFPIGLDRLVDLVGTQSP